jgi:hypothetical protein
MLPARKHCSISSIAISAWSHQAQTSALENSRDGSLSSMLRIWPKDAMSTMPSGIHI